MITKTTKKSCKDYEKNSQEGFKRRLWKWGFFVTKSVVAINQQNHCGPGETMFATLTLRQREAHGPCLSQSAVLKGKKDQKLSLSGFSCLKTLACSTGSSKRQCLGASVQVHLQPDSSRDRRSHRNILLKLSWTQHMRPNCIAGTR